MSANRRYLGMASARLAAASVSAGYVTLIGPVAGRGYVLQISNSLNGDVVLSLDGGTTDYITLPAGISLSIDFGTNNIEYSGTASVKQGPSGASTTGFISAGVIRTQ